MFLIHWVVWVYTFLLTIYITYLAVTYETWFIGYFLDIDDPRVFLVWGGPIFIFLIIDYIIIGELTSLPWEREK